MYMGLPVSASCFPGPGLPSLKSEVSPKLYLVSGMLSGPASP